MRKFYTFITVLFAVINSLSAQVAWNEIKVSTTKTPSSDTAYFAITSRGGLYQSFNSSRTDSVNAIALPSGYAPGDSAVWYVVKGAPYGSIPRIRLVNSRTGQFLYVGTKGRSSKSVYAGPRIDPYNGQKDLYLVDMGTKSTTQYYAFQDNSGDRIGNWTTGQLTVYSATGAKYANAANQWIFSSKKGPQPKAVALPAPEIILYTAESEFHANGNVSVSVTFKKEGYDFSGLALLYHGNTLIDTLTVNQQGESSFTYNGLVLGTEKFTVVYQGDDHYDTSSSSITLNVVEAATAKATSLTVDFPLSTEVHREAPLEATIVDAQNNVVNSGSVLVYINNILKNKLTVSTSGKAYLTIPNLIAGTHTIKTIYVGNGVDYLNSDTVRNSIVVGNSTSAVIPYPVYFDLCNQPGIKAWNYKYPVMASNATTLSHAFSQDSIGGIKLEIDSAKVTYSSLALAYTNTDYKDYYNHADNIVLSLGSGRSKWVNFTTPWLNEGSYNVYLSQRLPNSSIVLPITSVTVDDKELFWPEQELTGRWLNYSGTANNTRRWNAKAHSALLPLFYLGSVHVDKSDIHNLKITVADQGGSDAITLDMLQFIPVDQDSVTVNNTASTNFSKTYYPLFDLGAYARQANDAAYSNFVSYANMSIPYQETDKTNYTKIPYSVTDLVQSDPNYYFGVDYITIYKKDKWTRVVEGYVLSDATFATELTPGEYYYEEINYSPLDDIAGTSGYRWLLKSATFKVDENTAVNNPSTSTVTVSVDNGKLLLNNAQENSTVTVVDVLGKLVAAQKIRSNATTINVPGKGVYVVTISSIKEKKSVKVIL